MPSKQELLKKSRLYLILDRQASAEKKLTDIGSKLVNAGIDIIQLRNKESKESVVLEEAFFLRRILAKTKVIFIVNDHLDIAINVNSDGVHLGQEDTSIKFARRMLGDNKIIGVSCNNLEQAIIAQENGADYLGVGPIFASPLKPESTAIGLSLIEELNKRIKIPYFAIGDINLNNLGLVLSSGIKRVAVCRAILNAPNITKTIKSFAKALN